MERIGGGAGERTGEGSGMTDAPVPRVSSAAEKPAALEAAARVLAQTRSVLVIDWPSRDVPVSLAFAGFAVFVKGGPGPGDYAAWELDSGEPVSRPLGREPGRVDLVYCHRPLDELPGIIALAGRLGARALWWQTGVTSDGGKDSAGCWVPPEESRQARELADAAGLAYVDDVYLADAARTRGAPPNPLASRWRSNAWTAGVHGPVDRRTVPPERTAPPAFPPGSGSSSIRAQ